MRYIFAIVTFIMIASNVFAAQLKDTTITGNGTVTGNLKVTGMATMTNLNIGTGVVSIVGSETIVTYNTSSTFVVPEGVTSLKVLVVGGGAGGDGGVTNGVYGHGGGGGRVTYRSAFSVTAGASHTVTIGAGGALGLQDNQASDGVQSVFGVITAAGGTKANNIGAGGDGGDSGNDIDTVITNYNGLTDSTWGGAGGAGAGGVGGTVTDAAGGTGGAGYSSSITGSSVAYGTGGDGSGTGSGVPPTIAANLGLGGHGGTPRSGGSGVVIVRFITTYTSLNVIGKVGIGTSTPSTELHIVGSATVSGNTNLPSGVWNSSGNVGIGTTNITEKLTIGDGVTAGGITVRLNAPAANWAGLGLNKAGTEKWFIGMGDNATHGDKLLFRRTSSANDVVIDTAGKVGFGTDAPSAKLHSLATTEQLRLGYDVNNYWSSTVGSTGGLTLAGIGAGGALSLTPTSGQNLNVNLAGTGDLAVNTNQLYVDTSVGNVGIGTTVLGEKLHIASGNILLSNNQFLKGQNAAATTRSLIGINSNNAIIIGADGQSVGIGILTNSLSTLDVGGSMVVGTYAGVNSGPSNGLAVSGSVGIGTSTPSAQLHTTGTVRMQNFGAGTATFDANGNISSVSDERLKTISGNFSSGLSEILQIKPIVYKWNEKSGLDITNNYVGFSAQNLSKYIPEAVSINSEGYLSVSDRAVIAALVNAVKTLSDEVDSLKLKLSLPLTSHTVVANTDITKLGKTNYAKILRTPVLQGEETWEYIEEGTESKAQAVSAEDAFILVPGYTQNYLRDEVKIEFILEGEDVKQVTKIVPVYEQVFVKLQKKLKENVSLNSETGTFYKNVEVPKLVYKMKQGVSFDEVTKVYMRNETSAEALARVGKEIVSIIPKIQ